MKKLRQRKKQFVSMVFMLLCSFSLFAATPLTSPAPITSENNKIWNLSALSNLALSLNPATKLAWAQMRSAAAGVGLAQSAYWPTVNYVMSYSYLTHQRDNTDNLFGCNSNDKTCAALTLNYLIWDFGARRQQLNNAKYLLLASQLTQNETVQTVILQVDQSYYQLLGQQALLKANKISLQEAQVNLQSATALHNQGLATSSDVFQAQSALSEAQLILEQTAGQVKIAEGELAIAVGLPVQTKIMIQPLKLDFSSAFSKKTIEDLLIQAKVSRPDLLAAQAQVSAQQAALIAAQRQRWPTLSVQMGTQNAVATNGFNSGTRQNNLFLSLNYPIFTGFSTTYTIHQAQAAEETAKAQRDQLAYQIGMQVWQAYYNLQIAEQTVQTSRSYLKSSTAAAGQTLGQYRAGVGNILSVLTTQATEANARVQLIQSGLNWYLAAAQLSQAIGALQ